MHLELLWGGWMPLVLLAIHKVLDERKTLAGVAAGLLFVPRCSRVSTMACTSDGAGAGRTDPGDRSAVAGVRRAGTSMACGVVLAAIFLAPYFSAYVQARTQSAAA